jgi:hypothetical protein
MMLTIEGMRLLYATQKDGGGDPLPFKVLTRLDSIGKY